MNGRIPPAREPKWGRPDVQETGETLDPQRQHAQLLGLWSQGTKLVRRMQHRGYRDRLNLVQIQRWWDLARSLSERGLVVQILPLSSPVVFVGFAPGKQGWVSLVDVTGVDAIDASLYHRPIAIDFAPAAPSLRLDGTGPILAEAMVRKLSGKSLKALMDLVAVTGGRDTVTIDRAQDAEVVLAAWHFVPQMMRQARANDWVALARLWRHRGQALTIDRALSDRYPQMIGRDRDGRQRWRVP